MPNPRHAHLTTHIQVPRCQTPGRAPRGALTAASSMAHGVTTAPARTDRLLSVFQTRLGHFLPSNISLNGDEPPLGQLEPFYKEDSCWAGGSGVATTATSQAPPALR